jgi:uncharacterized membrane protein (UPF0127 family)
MHLIRTLSRFFRPAGAWRWGRLVGAALVGSCALLTLAGILFPIVVAPRPVPASISESVVTALRADPTVFVWGGNASAPTAYVFEDPNCLFCARFDQAAAPLVATGRLRLKVVLVAFLKPDSAGRAAAIWREPSPADALLRNVDRFRDFVEEGAIAPAPATEADRRALDLHLALLRRVGPVETPTVLFRQGNGWVVASGFQKGIFRDIVSPGRIPQPLLPTAVLRLGAATVTAEVARTPAQLETGLMGRAALAPDHGMLFIFPAAQRVCMWMKDTRIPLSVAFIDGAGRIVNTSEMRPETLDSHCSSGAARYALEMGSDWFAAHGVLPGARVGGLLATGGGVK